MEKGSDKSRFGSGDLIAGRYRVENEVGRGGMGIVLRAIDVQLGRPVALKMLGPEFGDDAGLRRRLATEARTASGLAHPGIATVFDLVEDTEASFIVYEFVDGRTLRTELADGRFRTQDLVEAGVQLADALAAAHSAGIIHRDLKPENIMVIPATDCRGRMKILDFGLARPFVQQPHPNELGSAATTISAYSVPGFVAGTIAYMAPEQLDGAAPGARSDIYALGLVLYEMATGCHPFRGRNSSSTIANILTQTAAPLRNHDPSAPAELDRIIHKCLRRPAAERYQSARELYTDLRNFRSDFGDSSAGSEPQREQVLMRKLLGSAGARPYRLWEILHIKMCIRCVLLVYLAWRFKAVTTGTFGLAIFFSELFCGTTLCLFSAFLLYLGAIDRGVLATEARRFAPWFRALGLANGLLALCMAAYIAEPHTILALLLALLGIAVAITALTFKPALDRAAVYNSK